MPRNRSEKAPTIEGASYEVLKFMRLEALGPLEEYLQYSLVGAVGNEYTALGLAARIAYRTAVRKYVGFPAVHEGIGCV